jgi:DNA-binding GntR family transcriptional regulator
MPPSGQATKFRNVEEAPVAQSFAAESPKSLSDQAYERLLDMILSGELAGGSILQERRLADALNISRTPTREALARLESEGLVTRQFGRLLAVRELTVQEFIEILNVRKLLEVEAAGLSAGNVPTERAGEVRTAILRLMNAESPTVAQHWAVDDMVHGLVAGASNNHMLGALIQDLRRRTHMFDMRRIPSRFRSSCKEHLDLVDAIEKGDAAAARKIAGTHIENVKLAIIDKLKVL